MFVVTIPDRRSLWSSNHSPVPGSIQYYSDLKSRKIESKCDRRKNYGPKASFLVFQNPAIQSAVWGASSIKLQSVQTQSVRNELYCKTHKNIELGNSIHTILYSETCNFNILLWHTSYYCDANCLNSQHQPLLPSQHLIPIPKTERKLFKKTLHRVAQLQRAHSSGILLGSLN